MPKLLSSLALAATLLAPLAASAQTPPATPATPTTPAAPTTPAPPAPKKHARAHGKISAVDAAKKTVTLTRKKGDLTLTLGDSAKIYKTGDTPGSPTGTFADLTVGTEIRASLTGDEAAPTATEIHILAPKP